jgi:2-keto-4-pentenoate hydratase
MPSADVNTVAEAAQLLATAQRTGIPTPPVRNLLRGDVASAYAVQRELARRRMTAGGVVVGRKIGLTSPAVQSQLGVDQPDFGLLFADMDVSGLPEVPFDRLLQPKVEAEVAFVLRADLADDDLDLDQVRQAIDYGVAALEIVDSRVADWDITISDTVADNASSGLFVLAERRLSLDEFEPSEVTMRMYADDVLVVEGDGSACLGNPLNALSWLAHTAIEYGDPLRAGQIVLSGALGPMIPVSPNLRVRAEIWPLGNVATGFSARAAKEA